MVLYNLRELIIQHGEDRYVAAPCRDVGFEKVEDIKGVVMKVLGVVCVSS